MNEKLLKGYRLSPGQSPVTPSRRVDPGLEAAVREHPLDERAYLVLADALSEAGDPRGELISVQHAIWASKGPPAPRLKAREKRLLSAFGLPEADLVSLDWRWGFVRAACFHCTRDRFDSHFPVLARQIFAMPMCQVLEELTLEISRTSKQRLVAVTRTRLGTLTKLVLKFKAGADVQVEDLELILEGIGLATLRQLVLLNCDFTDALCQALPRSPLLEQIEVLDLSKGTMTAEGAKALARRPAAFAHLAALKVDENFLDADGLKALKTLGCPIVTTRQKES